MITIVSTYMEPYTVRLVILRKLWTLWPLVVKSVNYMTDLVSCLHLNATLGCIIFIIIYFAVNVFLFLMSNYLNLINSHLFVWKMKAAEFFPKYPVLTEDM